MYQKTIIIGRLTRDPEMRYMPDGTAITNLNVAVGDRKKDASGNYTDHTTWFRVSVWGKQGENANSICQRASWSMLKARSRAMPVATRLRSPRKMAQPALPLRSRRRQSSTCLLPVRTAAATLRPRLLLPTRTILSSPCRSWLGTSLSTENT